MLVVSECGFEVCRFDRNHLLFRTLRANSGQVDEGANPPPGKHRNPLDQLLVMIDAIFSSRLRLSKAEKRERERKADDCLRGTTGHGVVLRRSARRRFLHSSHANHRSAADAASTSLVSGGVYPTVRTERHAALDPRNTIAVENSEVNGGSKPLTPRSQIGQIDDETSITFGAIIFKENIGHSKNNGDM